MYDIKSIAGTVNARFDSAFSFGSQTHRRKNRAQLIKQEEEQKASQVDTNGDGRDAEEFNINAPIALEGNFFARAGDFWQVVGWAFNCAARYRARWTRWKLWLEFMLEAIEDDWEERMRLYDVSKTDDTSSQGGDIGILEQSMATRIVTEATQIGGRTARRRIQRAIFADGSEKALNEFPELWPKETKEKIKVEVDVRRKENKLNLDEGQFGDYGEADSDDEIDVKVEGGQSTTRSTDTPVRLSSRTPKIPTAPATPASDGKLLDGLSLGGVEALTLRRRLHVIVSFMITALPSEKPDKPRLAP